MRFLKSPFGISHFVKSSFSTTIPQIFFPTVSLQIPSKVFLGFRLLGPFGENLFWHSSVQKVWLVSYEGDFNLNPLTNSIWGIGEVFRRGEGQDKKEGSDDSSESLSCGSIMICVILPLFRTYPWQRHKQDRPNCQGFARTMCRG